MIDKLMSAFNKSVATVSVKSESLMETSRVKSALSNIQRQKEEQIRAMGVEIYNSWCKDGIDVAAIEAMCQKINALDQDIAAQNEKLAQIKEDEERQLAERRAAAEAAAAASVGAAPAAAANNNAAAAEAPAQQAPVEEQAADTVQENDQPVCPSCGKPVSAESAFCCECGARLK